MLQALNEHGVTPDMIIGTSAGALNGAFLAADPFGGANQLSHLWPGFSRETFFPGSAWKSVRTLRTSKTYLFPNAELSESINNHIPPNTFEELEVPFVAMATDVDTRLSVALDTGDLRSALLASTAIPVIFPPVERDGRLLYDGGLVANLPIRQALKMNAASLVLLDCNAPGQRDPYPDSMSGVLEWTVRLMLRSQTTADLPYISETLPVLSLPAAPKGTVSPLDFDSSVELMAAAYQASRTFLTNVHVDAPRLYRADPIPPDVDDPTLSTDSDPSEGSTKFDRSSRRSGKGPRKADKGTGAPNRAGDDL